MMSDLPPPIPPSFPGTPPTPYPPVFVHRDQRKKDVDQLRLLSIFSYVSAGLAGLGIGFIVLHYNVMRTVAGNPGFFRGMPNQPGPDPAIMVQQMFGAFRWFYVVLGLWGVAMAILNVVSGYCLGRHRQRMFSMVVAGLNCLRLPLGTVLGVFTLMILTRDSVRQLYESENAGPALPGGPSSSH